MVSLNGEYWDIVFVDPYDISLLNSFGEFTLGVCDDSIKTIFINNQIQNEKLKKVICHELTHAAMFSYNVDLSIEQEEIVADILSTYGAEIIYMTDKIFKNIIKKGRV